MNNTEKNKLIAEFMGAKEYAGEYDLYSCSELAELFENVNGGDPDAKHFYHPYDMEFDSSWEWLNIVIKKIERENLEHYFGVLRISTNILRTYEGVVELIKLNNESNFNQ